MGVLLLLGYFSLSILDIFQVRQFFRFAKGEGNTVVAGTSGSSDTVHVCFRNVGQLIVDDV